MKDVSSLANEVQSVEPISLSMPPSLINRLNSFDRNSMFDSGIEVEGIILVSLSQFLLNQSLDGERERENKKLYFLASEVECLTTIYVHY